MARLEIARTAIVPTANILVSLETIWNEEIVKVWAAAWLLATRAWRQVAALQSPKRCVYNSKHGAVYPFRKSLFKIGSLSN